MSACGAPQSGDEPEFEVYGVAVSHEQGPRTEVQGPVRHHPPTVTNRDPLVVVTTTVMSLSRRQPLRACVVGYLFFRAVPIQYA